MMSSKSPVVRSQASRLTSLDVSVMVEPPHSPAGSLVVIKQVSRLVTPAKLSTRTG